MGKVHIKGEIDLKNGHLIGISRNNLKNRPEILIYIYETVNKNLRYSYKVNKPGYEYGLPPMMEKYEGGIAEINRKYGTRF